MSAAATESSDVESRGGGGGGTGTPKSAGGCEEERVGWGGGEGEGDMEGREDTSVDSTPLAPGLWQGDTNREILPRTEEKLEGGRGAQEDRAEVAVACSGEEATADAGAGTVAVQVVGAALEGS